MKRTRRGVLAAAVRETGFQATVTARNNGAATLNGWTAVEGTVAMCRAQRDTSAPVCSWCALPPLTHWIQPDTIGS